MPDNLVARDFMVPIEHYPHLNVSSSICDAFAMMHDSLTDAHKYRTILVTDDEQQLLGYLSLRDLIRAVGPSYLRKEAPSYKGNQPFMGLSSDLSALSLIWQEGFSLKIREEARKSLKGAITLIEQTVSPDDPFPKCVYLMLVQNELIIPVAEEGKVIGVIRLVDIFELIAENLKRQYQNES